MRLEVALLFCSSLALAELPPWAKELEALICKEAKKGSTEQTAIKAACGEITKKIPAVPEAACEKVGKTVFDDALKKCPSDEAMVSPLGSMMNGGSLKLTWKDCGDAETRGHVTGLSPDSIVLGQKTTVTGSGNLSAAATDGTFEMDFSVSIIKKTFTGDICKPSTFPLPFNLGSLTWDGMKCPLAPGSTSVATDISLSAAVPAKLAKAALQITAKAASGDKLLCMEVNTAPEATIIV